MTHVLCNVQGCQHHFYPETFPVPEPLGLRDPGSHDKEGSCVTERTAHTIAGTELSSRALSKTIARKPIVREPPILEEARETKPEPAQGIAGRNQLVAGWYTSTRGPRLLHKQSSPHLLL